MDLPSTRELELETLVRQRDDQLAELNDEITRLRLFVANQPAPSHTDPVTLPPPFMKLLLPQIKNASKAAEPSSSTVVNALTQKVKLLQEENDELYQILRVKETGKLKEEVRSLRKVVHRLEGSLRESHQVVESLSTELDKAHSSLIAASKQIPTAPSHHRTSRSPRPPRSSLPAHQPNSNASSSTARGLPTGPRAHKKPRLSDARQSPPPLQHPLPPNPRNTSQLPPQRTHQQSHHNSHNSGGSSRVNELKEAKSVSGFHKSSGRTSRMDVDEESNASSRNDRGRDRERVQQEGQQPPSERDRERDSRGNSGREKDDKDRNKERVQKGRDREPGGGRSNRENKEKDPGTSVHAGGSIGGGRNSVPRRNGAHQGTIGRVTTGSGSGGGGGSGQGRRGNSDRHSNAQGNGQVDRSLAERMGL